MLREELNAALVHGVNDGRLIAKVAGVTMEPDAHEKLMSSSLLAIRIKGELYSASDVTYSVPS